MADKPHIAKFRRKWVVSWLPRYCSVRWATFGAASFDARLIWQERYHRG